MAFESKEKLIDAFYEFGPVARQKVNEDDGNFYFGIHPVDLKYAKRYEVNGKGLFDDSGWPKVFGFPILSTPEFPEGEIKFLERISYGRKYTIITHDSWDDYRRCDIEIENDTVQPSDISLGVDPRCEACGMDFEVLDVQISKSSVSEIEIRAICPRGKCSTGPVTIRAQITDIERGEDNEKDETVES